MEGIDHEKLIAQADEEIAAEREGREPKDLLSTPPKEDDKQGEEKPKPDEEAKDEPEDGEGESDDADEKPAEDKAEDKKPEDDEDAKVTAYAEKHSMTYSEAKEDLDKTAEILKQFKNDPAELAKAIRNKDREYHKLKAESDKEKTKKEPVFKKMSDSEFRDFAKKTLTNKPKDADDDYVHPLVKDYRAKFPAKSELMSDDAIVEEVTEQELNIYRQKAGQKEAEIKSVASKKRESLIKGIAEADRRFIPDVKAVLLETDDAAVIDDDFSISDALLWAKGKRYDADIKAAEERGAKRSKEDPKIAGAQGSSKSSSKTGTALNEKQKKAALEMFSNNYDDATCYKMYSETFEEELKKDKNFI